MRRLKWIGALTLLAIAGCDCDDDVFVGPSHHHQRSRVGHDHRVKTTIDFAPNRGVCDPYYRPGPGLPQPYPPDRC
jgi:hypothetical protein